MGMAHFARGGTNYMMEAADPEGILQAIQAHGITHFFIPPTVLYMMLALPNVRDYDVSSLQHLLVAAAPVSLEKLKEAVEIFGPVMSVIGFKDAEEAVAIANDSIYGLAGAVWSNNINTAHRVAAAVRVGTMGINNYFGGDVTVPFGGFKQSGNGRDKSMHAFDDYTELKTTWIEFD